jgi:2-C-methyl-D-erythritol 2,4-cyclodiphosphate synthase
MRLRVGFGYDVHTFKSGRALVIGGVNIPHHSGLDGHSDADVLLHALSDAILGAAGLRDIGHHFPNTDDAIKDIDSKIILMKSLELVANKGWRIENIDATLVMEKPAINPHIAEMKKILAEILSVEEDAIGIKATTNEKMGFIGRMEGAAAYATVLLIQS